MDANTLGAVTSGLGIAGGLWALVRWNGDRRANGNGHAPDPAGHADAQREIAQSLEKLPGQFQRSLEPLTGRLEQLLERPVVTPSLAPEARPRFVEAALEQWSASAAGIAEGLMESEKRLGEIAARPVPSPVWPPEMAASLERITDRLEALLQFGPPPTAEPELAELTRLLAQLPGEFRGGVERLTTQVGELLAAERNRIARSAAPPGNGKATGGGGGSAPSRHVTPPRPRSPDVALAPFNTWTLAADSVYTLVPPEAGIFAINLLNLGPGTLFMRADANPAPDDPRSGTLPANGPDIRVHIPASLRVLVDEDSTITARLVHQ